MKCPICKHGETTPGLTTVTLERDGMAVVFRGVPGEVCDNCGERYFDDVVAGRVLELTEDTLQPGVRLDVREYQQQAA